MKFQLLQDPHAGLGGACVTQVHSYPQVLYTATSTLTPQSREIISNSGIVNTSPCKSDLINAENQRNPDCHNPSPGQGVQTASGVSMAAVPLFHNLTPGIQPSHSSLTWISGGRRCFSRQQNNRKNQKRMFPALCHNSILTLCKGVLITGNARL